MEERFVHTVTWSLQTGGTIVLHTAKADLTVNRSKAGGDARLTIYGSSPAASFRTDRKDRCAVVARVNDLGIDPAEYWCQHTQPLEVIPEPSCVIDIPPGVRLEVGYVGYVHLGRGAWDELRAQLSWLRGWRKRMGWLASVRKINNEPQQATA